ncbi:immunoglobulin superfamily member 11-like isoform X1 [Anabas testudineus]|uniref:Ig-like domain-containing protein n=1 Tax=Anabas testudineus TaxID=64144 RepID=A0A3Q1HUI8_ANATE|nr:immunoglobulin superfamily member 11-like isoform X1 [Anabas testudineus]
MLLTVHMSPVEMELLPLLCLCLLSVSGTTFADGNKPKVIKVTEGSDVILPCSTSTEEDVTSERIEWNKDVEKQVFLYEGELLLSGQDQQFTDCVSLYTSELQHGNASIEIKNTKLSDSGDYTCKIGKLQTNQTFPIQLLVVPLIIKVKEGNSVILPCSPRTKEDVKEDHFEWKKDGQKDVLVYKGMEDGTRHQQFRGRVSLFKDELKNGNASIKIRTTTEADSGNYTCEFPDLHETLHILLVVGDKLTSYGSFTFLCFCLLKTSRIKLCKIPR